jgi:3'-phosphoadenosine 5'-phosphosulfate sulfotransferase (PAPS reductase)/FAD synthetase
MKDNTPKNDPLRKFDKNIRKKFMAQPEEDKANQLKAKTFILYPFELRLNQAKSFEQKETETLHLIEEHLKTYKKCFVATSYGMDSIVLMHMVIRAAKNIGCEIPDMFLNDTLNTFKEEKAYWGKINKLFDIENKFKMFQPPKDKDNRQQTVWTIAKKFGHLPDFRRRQDQRKKGEKGHTPECCNILKKDSMKKFMKSMKEEERYDCHFIGTRAQESRMRAMSVLQRCRTYLITQMFPHPIRAVTPLSFWNKEDIYEYYARYNIPKNPTYKIHNIDRMGCASCPAHLNWEIRLAKDPTEEGFGMLNANLGILAKTDVPRLEKSLEKLIKFLHNKDSGLNEKGRERLHKIISQHRKDENLDNFLNPRKTIEVKGVVN